MEIEKIVVNDNGTRFIGKDRKPVKELIAGAIQELLEYGLVSAGYQDESFVVNLDEDQMVYTEGIPVEFCATVTDGKKAR